MEHRIAHLTRRAVVEVSGPDRESFLEGLLTQSVEGLAPGSLRFAALLTAQGKLLFDLFLSATADAIRLETAAPRRSVLIQRLLMYRLRARVEIAAVEDQVFAAWGPDSPPDVGWAPDPRLTALGWRAHGMGATSNASEADFADWVLLHGVPDPERDAEVQKTWPIEADFDLLNGIDFHKGCFVGQETTSRMKRRGQVKNRTLPFRFEGPAPGTGAEILQGELRAGVVLSTGAGSLGMALVRLDRLSGPLTVEGRPVSIEPPAWFIERAGSANPAS